MFLKTQYLQGGIEGLKGSGDTDDNRGFARRGVVFATGTPVANTIAEAWTMMRYLQNRELHRRGYQHFDAWVRTYGRIESGLEQTPQGKYKQVTRFANFNNLPELSALLQNVADIRVASEVPQMLEAQPRLVDREGKAKRITEKAPIYPSLKKYMGHLIKRADNMGKVDPSVDNMLKLSSDARKASLDIRMVQWPFEEPPVPNPEGKIPMAAANVAEVYQAEADSKGTQIVFLDLATPKGQSEDKPAKQAKQGDEEGEGEGDDAAGNAGKEALTEEEQKIVKDAYNMIRRELLAKGVPADQIAFIHDYDTKKKQLDLFDKVRAGDVRVLLGSTGKLGVGVNVQDRAAAIHHIDVPWRPRDIEQREGRIVRQGNKVYGPVFDEETGDLLNPGKGVKIFNYVQEGSFDEFMWQGIQIKGQAIKSLVKRYVTQRKVEDIDPLVLGAAEAKALASGDPRIMRLEELRQKVQTLRLERAAHDSNARNSAVQAQQLVEQVAAQRRRLPKIEIDAQIARKATDAADEFAMTIGAQSHAKRPDADQAIKKSMKALPFKGDWRQVGEYGGLNVMAVNTDTGYRVALLNPATDVLHQSSDITELGGANVVTRIDNVLKGIANSAADLRKKLDQSEESLSFYQGEVGQRFDGSVELKQAEGELQFLRRDIEGVKEDDAPEGEAYEVAADTQVSAIITDADDETYDAAREKVMSEVVSTMQSGGRDFVMPTQADVEERIAQELLKQPRPEPASSPERTEPEPPAEEVSERIVNEITEPDPITEPDAVAADPVAAVEPEADPTQVPDAIPADPVAAQVEPEPAQEPDDVAEPDAVPAIDNPHLGPVAAEVSQRVIDDINDADPTGPVVVADERVTDEVADEVADAIAETPNPSISEVATGAGDGPAVVAVEILPIPDLVPGETEDVAERVAGRVLDDIADYGDQGEDVTVITNDDLDGMILEEVRDEASTLAPDISPAKPEPVVQPGPVAAEPDALSADPAPIVIDGPPAIEPMVADEPAPLVEPLPTSEPVDPGVAERAAELEQEIALRQSQAEVAKQQHPNPTAAVAEVRADIATAEANLEALSDAVGLPDPDTLPDNVVRLELQSDGSVTAVVSDSPTPAPEPEPTPEPTRQRVPVESDQPKEPVEPTRKPVADHTPGVGAQDAELVDTRRAWQDLTHEEKARAVAEYNRALSALRTLAEVAREIEETNNVGWAWEAKCSQLQQELTALLRPTPQSPLLAPLIEPMATPVAMPGIERTPAITAESTGYT